MAAALPFPIKWGDLASAEALLKDGATVVTAMAAAEPQMFFNQAAEFLRHRKGVKVYCANPNASYEVFDNEDLAGCVELRPMFVTAKIGHHQNRKHVHYIPQHLSQWTTNILREGPVDVFWGSCSVPDDRGFVSIGPSNCYEYDLLRKARHIVLEVNPQMPFTFGATCLSVRDASVFLSVDYDLPKYHSQEPDAHDCKIAAHVGELIPDGATLQLGIGSIPNALTEVLKSKKDLGIHTEMINDSVLELYEEEAVTGRCKTLWPDKIIGSFAYGSEKLYSFIDKNPMVELHPAVIVNDPVRIGRNHKMTSINTAVEVDITGQVCSESIGHLELSGVGGATDTHIGCQRSPGGRGIIALKSRTKKGHQKIVFELKPGAKVSIGRNDVDTIVTEYGVAPLRGKTVAQRAKNLIAVAHPESRERLMFDAKKVGYF